MDTPTPPTPTSLWRFGSGIAGVAALLGIVIALNVLIGGVHLRQDLTADRLFTLSAGTRAVLAKLDEPITLKFYVNAGMPEVPPPLKTFAQQVEDLLREYALAGGSRIVLEKYNPLPDSDDEEWAERYGLAGRRMDMMGPPFYLGLAVVRGDAYAAIPFFDPRAEELMEYNITRLITRVAHPKKPVIGVWSSLPVLGVKAYPFTMPGQPRPRSQPPWGAFQDLAADYDVRSLTGELTSLDADLDALILVHPKDLSEQTQFAIDQFVLRGGRLIAFLDPFCLTENQLNQSQEMPMGLHPASDLGRLLPAWGVTYEADKVLADMDALTRVRRGEQEVEDSPVFLSLRDRNVNAQDVTTANLESLLLPCAGAFAARSSDTVTVTPLLTSSDQCQLVPTFQAQMGADAIRRDFKSELQGRVLALRLHGQFQTAFPDGKPKAAAPDKQDAAPPLAAEAPALTNSAAPTTIILVADADLLHDQFALQELNFFGQRAFQPMNDNINFFYNVLEQVAGAYDLAAIRSRGRFERPFDRVLELQRAAQEKWLLEERALQQKLDATREQLEQLQQRKDKSQRTILSPEQQATIETFKQEQLRTQQELKRVRKNLREGIERLGVWVKTLNIVLMPLVVSAAGILFWSRRRALTRQP